MIEARMLSEWDCIVGSVASLAIIVLALCVMVGTVKVADAPRHLGAIVGIVILLIMLPAIIVSLWNSMSFWQHFCIIVFGIAMMLLLGASRRRPHNVRRR